MAAWLMTIDYWHWLALAGILFILEIVFASGGFLLWLGISAVVTAVLNWLFPAINWSWQLVVFSLGGIIASVGWWFYLQRHPLRSDQPVLNKRAHQYMGRVFNLEEPIVNGRGTIRVDDSTWRVSGVDMPAGSKVKVIAVEGVILRVEMV